MSRSDFKKNPGRVDRCLQVSYLLGSTTLIFAVALVGCGEHQIDIERNDTAKSNQATSEFGLALTDKEEARIRERFLESADRGDIVDLPFSDPRSIKFSPGDSNLAAVLSGEHEASRKTRIFLWDKAASSVRVVAQDDATTTAPMRHSPPSWSPSGNKVAWCEYRLPSFVSPSSSRVELATSSVLYLYDVDQQSVIRQIELPFVAIGCAWPSQDVLYILENVWFDARTTPYGRIHKMDLRHEQLETTYAARDVLILFLMNAGQNVFFVENIPPEASLPGTPPTSRRGSIKGIHENSPKFQSVYEWSGYSLSDFSLSGDGSMLACCAEDVNDIGGMSVLGIIDLESGTLHRSIHDPETIPLCWLPGDNEILCKKRIVTGMVLGQTIIESKPYSLRLGTILGK